MAYKNLIAEVLDASSETEWFMRMRDFLCARNGTYDYSTTGIGWTLHDYSYAVDEDNVAINDYIVLFSAGEDGGEQMYYQFILINDYIRIRGWQYWNNSTHTGSGINYYRDNAMKIGADPEEMYIYGDLNFVHMSAVGVDGNTNWYNGAFGCLDTRHLIALEDMGTGTRNIQVCTSSLSSGSDVEITVSDSTSKLWKVGCHLMIMDNTNFERITVKTNDNVDTITADLTNSYSANAKICTSFPYYVTGANTTHFYYNSYCVLMHNMLGEHAGGNQEVAVHTIAITSAILGYNLGTGWNDAYALCPYAVSDATAGAGLMGFLPNCGYTAGTGLTIYDVLDDVTDPTIQWRFVNTTNARVYKELV